MNGPLPTGWLPKPTLPYFLRAVGEAIPKLPAACWCRKPAFGAVKLISTVYGSMILVSLYGPRAPRPLFYWVSGSTMWS